DGVEHGLGRPRFGGKYRPVLDIIERRVRAVRQFLDDRSANVVAPVLERDAEILELAEIVKLPPPRALHKTGFRRPFEEFIPGFPRVARGNGDRRLFELGLGGQTVHGAGTERISTSYFTVTCCNCRRTRTTL